MRKMCKATSVCLLLVLILSLIAGCGGETKKEAEVYEVLVTDKDQNPISDVSVQFCSDSECIMGTTGEDGIARFEKEAGTYTIHVLKVPEGFTSDDKEYNAPEKPGTVTIVLESE